MWEESEKKKGMSCCLVVVVCIVALILAIVMIVYSFFFSFFSAFSSNGNVGIGDGTYRFPLRGEIVVNSPFAPARVLPDVYGDYTPRAHNGTDFKAAYGTEVIASRDGVVSGTYRTWSGGLTVSIDHGDGEETRYLHLSEYACSVGDTVAAGDTIAYSGNSGAHTQGPHLHFEIIVQGTPIDAMTVLTAW